MNPVILPPGRGRLSTNPSPTGSETAPNTIGIVDVSRCSAAVGEVPWAKITSSWRRTSSLAYIRCRLRSEAPHRISKRTFRPSVQPNSRDARIKLESQRIPSESFSPNPMRTPTRRRRSLCSAIAAADHAAAPPSSVTNSRREIWRLPLSACFWPAYAAAPKEPPHPLSLLKPIALSGFREGLPIAVLRGVTLRLRRLEAFHHQALSVPLPQLAHSIGSPAVAAQLQAWGQRRDPGHRDHLLRQCPRG